MITDSAFSSFFLNIENIQDVYFFFCLSICFILYFSKLSACRGFYVLQRQNLSIFLMFIYIFELYYIPSRYHMLIHICFVLVKMAHKKLWQLRTLFFLHDNTKITVIHTVINAKWNTFFLAFFLIHAPVAIQLKKI